MVFICFFISIIIIFLNFKTEKMKWIYFSFKSYADLTSGLSLNKIEKPQNEKW